MKKIFFIFVVMYCQVHPVSEKYIKENYEILKIRFEKAFDNKYYDAALYQLEKLKEQFDKDSRAINGESLRHSINEMFKINDDYLKNLRKQLRELKLEDDGVDIDPEHQSDEEREAMKEEI